MGFVILTLLLVPWTGSAQVLEVHHYRSEASLAQALQPGPAPGIAPADAYVAAKVVFTGEVRPLGAEAAEGMRAWIAARPDRRPETFLRYVREFQFEDRGQRVWLPVAEGGDLARRLARAEQVEVFIDVAGSVSGRVVAAVRRINHGWDRSTWRPVNAEAHAEALRVSDHARDAVERIRECLIRFSRAQPRIGVPDSLAALGPAGTDCLDAELTGASAEPYRITFVPGVRDATGRAHIFMVCAKPARDILDGVETHVADEGGLARAVGTDYDDGRSLSCAQAGHWDYDPLRHVKLCLLVHADRERGTGYPSDLLGFGPEGNGCLVLRADGRAKLHDTVFETQEGLLYYEPDKVVPRTRFQLRYTRNVSRHRVEYLTTETGSRHAALDEGKGATRESPEAETFLAALIAGDEADRVRQHELRASCDAGRFVDCYELAHRRLLWNDFAEASKLWRTACDRGVAESCLYDRKRLEAYRDVWSVRCGGGDADACWVERAHDPNSVYYHALGLRRACEDGKRASCEAIAGDAAKLAAGQPILKVNRPAFSIQGTAPR